MKAIPANFPLPAKTAFGLIRLAQPGDSAALIEMIKRLAAWHGDCGTPTAESLGRDVFGERGVLRVLVAEGAPGALLGYAALATTARLQFGQRGMELHHLFVADDMRGLGVGLALVRASLACARAEECSYLNVGTLPDNHHAQAFYLRAGFVPSKHAGPRFSMKTGA